MLFASVLQMSLISVIEIQGQMVNKIANGKTYVYDNDKKRVYKPTDINNLSQKFEAEGFDVENYNLVPDTYRKILSPERIKEHQKDMVAVSFECDVNGKIEFVKFVFSRIQD